MTRTACDRCGAPAQGDLCGFCRGTKIMVPSGAELIAAERRRQVTVEGWTEEHDDRHESGELALAALAYLDTDFGTQDLHRVWPWSLLDFKPSPKDRVRELVKAGALIAAEIDRLKRRDG